LPHKVKNYFGLQYVDGAYGVRDGSGPSLAQKNDYGSTFDEIADIIESKPVGLFVEDEEIA
jgi:hypothetical protein